MKLFTKFSMLVAGLILATNVNAQEFIEDFENAREEGVSFGAYDSRASMEGVIVSYAMADADDAYEGTGSQALIFLDLGDYDSEYGEVAWYYEHLHTLDGVEPFTKEEGHTISAMINVDNDLNDEMTVSIALYDGNVSTIVKSTKKIPIQKTGDYAKYEWNIESDFPALVGERLVIHSIIFESPFDSENGDMLLDNVMIESRPLAVDGEGVPCLYTGQGDADGVYVTATDTEPTDLIPGMGDELSQKVSFTDDGSTDEDWYYNHEYVCDDEVTAGAKVGFYMYNLELIDDVPFTVGLMVNGELLEPKPVDVSQEWVLYEWEIEEAGSIDGIVFEMGGEHRDIEVRIDEFYIDYSLANDSETSMASLTYPSPFVETLNVDASNATSVSVVSSIGSVVYQDNMPSADLSVNTKEWKSGIYFVVINRNGVKQTVKVIK
ncbi:MAG: T9SS type A sorting domain-containing protein [Ichthyobacteriaceae bacterium]|nr:T9SS type A sorting domain-containing protein [Ichthyobacteriaceae bacterium]